MVGSSTEPHPYPIQGRTLDDLGRPWTYYPDVGALVASPVAGRGEGRFRYERVDSECCDDDEDEAVDATTTRQTRPIRLKVVLNEAPVELSVFAERRRDSVARTIAKMLSLCPPPRDEDEDSSSDSVPSVVPAEDDLERTAVSARGSSKRAPLPRRRTLHSKRRLTDQDLPGCVVTIRPRAGSNREDLKIVTPDGRYFRSRIAALTHLLRTQPSASSSEDSHEDEENEEDEEDDSEAEE
jgi:hypothetical protein